MRRFRAAPTATTPEPIRRPFILNFDGNVEDMSMASPVPGNNALGDVSFPGVQEISVNVSANDLMALPALPPVSSGTKGDPVMGSRRSSNSNSSVARLSQHQQRAAMRSNPALRMSQAKKLAHSQLRRLAKDPKGSAMAGMTPLSDKDAAAASSLKAARAQHVAELRAELREESTERWVYKRAPSNLSKSMSLPGTIFARPAPTKSNAGPKPRPGASFTVEQKRKLRKWFNKLDSDGSGEISTDELEDPLLSTGIAKTVADVEALVEEVDKDGSREIGFAEFLSVLQPGSPEKPGAAAAKVINMPKTAKCGGGGKKNNQKKGKLPEKKENPILKLQKMQDEASLSLDTVICAKRRELIIDAVMNKMVKSVRAQQETEYKYERARLEHDDDKMEELRVLKDVQGKEINERGEFLDAMRRVVVTSYNTQFSGADAEDAAESVDTRTPAEKAADRRRQRQLEDMAAAANNGGEDPNFGGDWYERSIHKAGLD